MLLLLLLTNIYLIGKLRIGEIKSFILLSLIHFVTFFHSLRRYGFLTHIISFLLEELFKTFLAGKFHWQWICSFLLIWESHYFSSFLKDFYWIWAFSLVFSFLLTLSPLHPLPPFIASDKKSGVILIFFSSIGKVWPSTSPASFELLFVLGYLRFEYYMPRFCNFC